MGIVLFRVDERLIHGQVTVAWGNRLRPRHYMVVDDLLRGSEWEQDLYRLGLPSGVGAEFLSVAEARTKLSEWKRVEDAIVVLTRDVEHMVRLASGGELAGEVVNLGGIHHRPGRTQVLPYLFIDSEDKERIRVLESGGVTVLAQDLPGTTRTSASTLLHD